jgi:transcriptional regulator with XRE-family HTH domain
MGSELGKLIRQRRLSLKMGLRELSRIIERSASFVVMIEQGDPAPKVGEDTLRRIAQALDLEADKLISLAGKVPEDVQPSSDLEIALYRQVKDLSEARKRQLLRQLRERKK